MAKDRLTGKLAVILYSDIAGSMQMVQRDEHLAHQRIQGTFQRFPESISTYSSKVLELRGDALLAEFGRPSDVVAATLEAMPTPCHYILFTPVKEFRFAIGASPTEGFRNVRSEVANQWGYNSLLVSQQW